MTRFGAQQDQEIAASLGSNGRQAIWLIEIEMLGVTAAKVSA